jgi:hypothetical protein
MIKAKAGARTTAKKQAAIRKANATRITIAAPNSGARKK